MNFLAELGDLAGDALASGGVQVSVKTNLGPEWKLEGQGGLARALGIQGAVIVRDRQGNVLFRYGEPPATNVVLVAALALTVAALGFFLVRGVVKK